MEQELFTFPEHLSLPSVFSEIRVTRFLALCVCFVDRCPFVLFLLATVLSVFLSFGHCVVCFSVFWPLCCLFFFDMRILITSLVSSNSSCAIKALFCQSIIVIVIRLIRVYYAFQYNISYYNDR